MALVALKTPVGIIHIGGIRKEAKFFCMGRTGAVCWSTTKDTRKPWNSLCTNPWDSYDGCKIIGKMSALTDEQLKRYVFLPQDLPAGYSVKEAIKAVLKKQGMFSKLFEQKPAEGASSTTKQSYQNAWDDLLIVEDPREDSLTKFDYAPCLK